MIYLLRHGETQWNVEQRRQGRGDSPLTARGLAQSQAVGELLAELLGADRHVQIMSSPAERSYQTACIVASALGIEKAEIERTQWLDEMDFGLWQGLTDTEIAEQFPDEWRLRQLNRWTFSYPEGESYPELCSRVAHWMDERDPDRTTIAVTHQWTSRVIRGQYLRYPKQEMMDLMHDHGLVVKLDADAETLYRIASE
jgi:probable phosphoglycerate mutase